MRAKRGEVVTEGPNTKTFKRGTPQIVLGFLLTIWTASIGLQIWLAAELIDHRIAGRGWEGLGAFLGSMWFTPIAALIAIATSVQATAFRHRIDVLPRRVGVAAVFVTVITNPLVVLRVWELWQ